MKKYINEDGAPFSKEQFIDKIKNDKEFCDKFGELGPVYGKQWRSWNGQVDDISGIGCYHDQIANLINDLKTNPDSRRLMVNAWNVGELDSMTLPPCHYGFQVYTRELSLEERHKLALPIWKEKYGPLADMMVPTNIDNTPYKIPTRAISLMWNQRSCDFPLGIPFNIASYGLLLEIIGKMVNMVPDELIGNLGDCHIYLNQIEGCEEQIGRYLEVDERVCMCYENPKLDLSRIREGMSDSEFTKVCDEFGIPTRTREPFELPTLNINTEFWPYEGGECGVGPIDAMSVIKSFSDDNFCRCLLEEDIQLSNYQSHPTIKFPLSN